MMAKMSIKAVWVAMATRVPASAARSAEARMVRGLQQRRRGLSSLIAPRQFHLTIPPSVQVRFAGEDAGSCGGGGCDDGGGVGGGCGGGGESSGEEGDGGIVCQQWQWATRPRQQQRCRWHPLADAAAVVKGAEKQQKTATSWQPSE